jgi:NADH:ubiquinone oxidoreductase subunit C
MTANFSTLIDASALDLQDHRATINDLCINFNKNAVFLYYIYYIYTTKLRLTFFVQKEEITPLLSLTQIYQNSNWLEREFSEMFNLKIKNKIDQRLLLLDYTKTTAPLEKNYPCESNEDIYYNFFNNQLYYAAHDFIEL